MCYVDMDLAWCRVPHTVFPVYGIHGHIYMQPRFAEEYSEGTRYNIPAFADDVLFAPSEEYL